MAPILEPQGKVPDDAPQELANHEPAVSEEESGQDMILRLLLEEDEITWQAMIYDLVAQEKMDPWDVDISLLAVKFLVLLRKLKEMDFRISGKVVLASALLLRLKSERLVDEDLALLDKIIHAGEEGDLLDVFDEPILMPSGDHPAMYARTPQPRKRKVSLYDLMAALEKALEVQNRRKRFLVPLNEAKAQVPERKFDLGASMQKLFDQIDAHYKHPDKKNKRLLFDHLLPSPSKTDKVLTFIPLLHLDTARKVDLTQEKHFGEIEVALAKLDPNFLAGIHENDVVKDGQAAVKMEAAKKA
jgi:segregation and condensation protein A